MVIGAECRPNYEFMTIIYNYLRFEVITVPRELFGKLLNSMSEKRAHFHHYSTHIDRFMTLQYQIKKKSIPNTILEVGSSDLPLQTEGYILLQCVARKHGQYMQNFIKYT